MPEDTLTTAEDQTQDAGVFPEDNTPLEGEAQADEGSWVKSLVDKVRGRGNNKPATNVAKPDPAVAIATGEPSKPSVAELRAKAARGEELSANEFLDALEAAETRAKIAEETARKGADAAQGTQVSIVRNNAAVAARHLSQQLGQEISLDDVLATCVPLSEWIESEYKDAAGSPQSFVDTFMMIANRHRAHATANKPVVKSPRKAPTLPSGSAGSAPATKSLKEAMNEAYLKAL